MKVSEVVITQGSVDPAAFLTVLERLSAGRWLSLWDTFVRDVKETLRGRKDSVSGLNDNVLMALALDGSDRRDQAGVLGTADPRFVCQLIDHF